MDFNSLIEYLQNKKDKIRLEILALHAIKDKDFMQEYSNLDFTIHLHQFRHVVSNPHSYDSPTSNDNEKANYNLVLVEIINTYTGYLYDNKGKYSNLKESISKLEERIKQTNASIDEITSVSKLISGEKVLQVYAKEFKKRSDDYETEAGKWQKKLYVGFSILGAIFVSFFFLNVIDINVFQKYLSDELVYFGYFTMIAIKIIILVGLIQVIRFFYRNYNANKHLANQSLHKCDVLRSLHGIYTTISSDNKEARDELIKTGALTAFQNIESGYITTKEGAGGADAGLFAAISGILKK